MSPQNRLIERMQHYVFPASTGGLSTANFTYSGEAQATTTFTAVTPGAGGNAITITVVSNNGVPGGVFGIVVIGTAITITGASDGLGIPTTTGSDVVTAMAATPAAAALVTTTVEAGTGGMLFSTANFGPTNLSGGAGSTSVGQTGEGTSLRFDIDAPFRLYGIVIWNMGTQLGDGFEGQIALRFSRPDGRFTQKVITAANLLFPGNRYNFGLTPNKAMCCPVYPNILYPAGSTITFDLNRLPGAAAPFGTIIVLVGTKLFRPGDIWSPGYPAKFTARDYLDNVTVPNFNPLNGPLYNSIFTAQQDSDFVWQAGKYTDFPTGASGSSNICQLVDLGVVVKDQTYKPYSNGYVPAGLLFPFLGAEMPGFLYPEIYVPSQQQLNFDLNYLYPGFTPGINPVTVVLGMKGMKVYPQ